ncbi:MAG: hypothetical protein IJR70_07720 [Eubacterium sp.]|nr:hypothetical protein [Eubacterium sp.]
MATFVIDNEALKKGWGAEGQYWFSFIDYSIVEDFDLMHIEVPENIEKEEFFRLKDIIPYANVKRYELAKAYIDTLDNKKIKLKFDSLENEEIVEYFWKYFHIYPDLFDGFGDFQTEYLLNVVKNWCGKHNINYTVKL